MRDSKHPPTHGPEHRRSPWPGLAAESSAGGPTEQLHKATALIIDDKPTSRSILATQLREMGVGTVVQCNRIADARLRLETRPYDIVLCEHTFADSDFTGQDLLEDLRRCNMLPFSTIFVMITGEASYAKVAEAAESALDVYLLKPHNAAALADRIGSARRRKISLAPIFAAIEGGDFSTGARLCLERFTAKGPYWLYAARIGAELLLRVDMHAQARMLYEAVIACQTLPWARLGIARAHLDAGESSEAISTLQALVSSDPSFVDAHDVLGRALFEQGELASALETYQRASELTPGSITRLQKHGALAFHIGDRVAGVRALEKAVTLGLGSRLFDSQSLVLLALARFKERDTRGLQRCLSDLQRLTARQPDSARLRRHEAVAATLNLMLLRRVGDVVAALRTMAEEVQADDFDMEAACNLIALVSVLTAEELRLESVESWIETMALRHCVNRATTELLASSAQAHEPFAQRVRAAHLKINAMAEAAIGFNLAGDPRSAVLTLLDHGVKTLNTKLVDLAQGVLDRHRHPIDGAGELRRRIEALRQRWAGRHWLETGDENSRRVPGGMVIRGESAARRAGRASTILPSVAPPDAFERTGRGTPQHA